MRPARHLLLLVLVLAGSACGLGGDGVDPETIRIGAGSTVEQRVLAGLTQVVLDEAGFSAMVMPDLGDTVDVRAGALDGEIDVYWDYTGAAWALALGRSQPSPDARESFEAVRAADADNGLRWLGPTDANATLALFVRGTDRPAGEEGTLSWLAGQLPLTEGGLCADRDFLNRPEGYRALADAYAISTDLVPVTRAGESKAITSVATGECFAALATVTSGTAVNAGLLPVIDDQRVFPAFVVAPVIAEDGRAASPAIVTALEGLATRLDDASLAALNARVIGGEDPRVVAEEWLGDG